MVALIKRKGEAPCGDGCRKESPGVHTRQACPAFGQYDINWVVRPPKRGRSRTPKERVCTKRDYNGETVSRVNRPGRPW